MPFREFVNVGEESLRRVNVAVGNELVNTLRIDGNRHVWMVEYGLDFRSENQRVVLYRVIERLDAEPVTRQEQFTLVAIPNGKGEHAVQVMDTFLLEQFVKVKDDFSIRAARAPPCRRTARCWST